MYNVNQEGRQLSSNHNKNGSYFILTALLVLKKITIQNMGWPWPIILNVHIRFHNCGSAYNSNGA
ncbi:hypothetical protein BBC0122_019120 [Bartonella choladocola]|uniref:Uncharacterized protein n=1 Tax=Bartonella choladocola TaxID=2750995 RepID=A0A1U9MJH6_9HYPH|nr:hypothetical protein BBC0122_019120 [Bartonella choladocola]